MYERDVSINLTEYEALVLFEWLSRLEDDESAPIDHEAEQKVLWVVEGQLEKSLSAQFAQNYAELLEEARRAVNDKH